ncbi:uncharacterized protein PFL1_02397 [Pseudozyma flocculosa PF-1]|uniref:DUF7707 domain-containing protein n=1 Tax=Pseudozyma flocculosa TaxID=84751 RepID=A0A5C3F8V4_9BASI|nr:uncharacterized protein PFL1_02397 [Pseudozyma flocculosa PF-1]EPQ30281.1 hypothetical protein PFL1_02397 [Pseudozyma flocculosa PF-1]SPO39779.1 uncharacterized protein PSFLO_05260 [Pseudozyma flocculosa]
MTRALALVALLGAAAATTANAQLSISLADQASKAQPSAPASLDLGGGLTSGGAPAATQAPPTPTAQSSVATTPLPTGGSVSVVSGATVSQLTSSSINTSPAVAQGTLTYSQPPLPSSTTTIDVSALPTSLPPYGHTVSSNFTLPSATATATFATLPQLASNPYQMVFADTSGLPDYQWNLALASVPSLTKEAICRQQVDFCAKAGCVQDGAKVKDNFCETKYMGAACRCDKGDSRLQQYNWPVMLADCRGRNTACKDACQKPNLGTADKNKCTQACDANYGSNCGAPGQYAANYAVAKKGQKPSYAIIQGGNAQNDAPASQQARRWATTAVAAASAFALVVLV